MGSDPFADRWYTFGDIEESEAETESEPLTQHRPKLRDITSLGAKVERGKGRKKED